MSLLSLVPKLIEKTQQGKVTWERGPLSEFHYISDLLSNGVTGLKHTVAIEQISTVNESNPESTYYIKIFDCKEDIPKLEFMEKVELSKISGLLKEVRNHVLNKNYSNRIEQINGYLDTI